MVGGVRQGSREDGRFASIRASIRVRGVLDSDSVRVKGKRDSEHVLKSICPSDVLLISLVED